MTDTSPRPGPRVANEVPPAAAPGGPFGVVVPVKRLALAKSRLAPLGDAARQLLVPALATDTVLAAAASPLVDTVIVVTDDPHVAGTLAAHGIRAVPDGEPGALNATLQLGAAELVRLRPGLRPVALCADLPALRADELTSALSTAALQMRGLHAACFVSDAAGVGTTMYAAAGLRSFRPRFGRDSRNAHLRDGAVEIVDPGLPSLRRDVDTPDDLWDAAVLGLGARTSWVLDSLDLSDPATTD